jgi:predicted nucleic acid-binding Zn ribbon protein
MSVTEEDGGKLNAFAKEPRMEVMEAGKGRSRSTTLLLVGGVVLVLVMVAVAAGIS